ncbi:MAG: 16S rRNA (uracil(1498)-N(3))-methyltransferase [Clostridia bacterium]|nr:16S rRNA (uracil(1498)-N(3))-methyltransferase [Clostridia bacterium]
MPRFFIRADQVENDEIGKIVNIIGEDAHHISRSLRMTQGEMITACDMQKTVYECELISFEQERVRARVINESKSDTEPPCQIRIYQAIPKGDKLETVIQKSIECGAYQIIPFSSERCIAKIDKKDASKKALRHNKIAESAAKQSGRGIIPEVLEAMSFKQAMAHAAKSDLMIFCYEGDGTRTLKEILREKSNVKDVSLIIGAEGGFSLNEVEYVKTLGAELAGLGKRILRCETAGAFALACIVYELEM